MSNETENGTGNELFPLDEAAISMLADIRTQMRTLESQWQGALVLFLRQHGLKGNWRVNENGRELVRTSEAAPVVERP